MGHGSAYRLGPPHAEHGRPASGYCSSHNRARSAGGGGGEGGGGALCTTSGRHTPLRRSVALLGGLFYVSGDPANVWIIHQVLRLKAKPSLASKLHKSQSAPGEARGGKAFLRNM